MSIDDVMGRISEIQGRFGGGGGTMSSASIGSQTMVSAAGASGSVPVGQSPAGLGSFNVALSDAALAAAGTPQVSSVDGLPAGGTAAYPGAARGTAAAFSWPQTAATASSSSSVSGVLARALGNLTSNAALGAGGLGNVSATGNQVVQLAERYLGVPYRWGGTDPRTGLDCSGLVQLVYRQLGVNLPRTSQEQASKGTAVPSLADAQPGDLLAFQMSGGQSGYDHIGIYVGNGMMIQAPRPGSTVEISAVADQGVTPTIRRVLPSATSGLGALGGAPGLTAGSGGSAVPYAAQFRASAATYGIDPTLLAAVAKTESNFRADAMSPAGARGLMQFMPATAGAYGIDPMNPTQAIDGAAHYLSDMLRRYGGDTSLALAAYNAGAGAVDRYGGIPPFRETQAYIQKVQSARGEITL